MEDIRKAFRDRAAQEPGQEYPNVRQVGRYTEPNMMNGSLTAGDVYDTVAKHDYGAVPRGATAWQGIMFLASPRFSSHTLNLVEVDPLRATDLAFGVIGKLAPGQVKPYVAAAQVHPMAAALEATSPKASAYYKSAFEKAGTEDGQDPDRTAWQTARRAYLDKKDSMTAEQVEAAANTLAQNEALARLGTRNHYSEVDALLAVADTLPSGAAFDRFIGAHIKPSQALADLQLDAPTTADDMLSEIPTRRLKVESRASAKAAPASGAPVPPAA